MSLSYFHFVFITELITIWHAYIHACIQLLTFLCTSRPKKVENHYTSESHLYNKVVSTIQHSLESKQSLAFLRILSIGTSLRYSKIFYYITAKDIRKKSFRPGMGDGRQWRAEIPTEKSKNPRKLVTSEFKPIILSYPHLLWILFLIKLHLRTFLLSMNLKCKGRYKVVICSPLIP